MKLNKICVAVFLAGLTQINCSSASAAADETTAAADVTYANTDSGLDATTVQAAIDELKNAYGSTDVAADLVGTWTGNVIDEETNESSGTITLVFNADNSASCTTTAPLLDDFTGLYNWQLYGKTLLNTLMTVENNQVNRYIFKIAELTSTSLIMHSDDASGILVLSR